MNTWVVARHPVALYKEKPVLGEDSSLKQKGEKVFLLKGRIMAEPGRSYGQQARPHRFQVADQG